MSPSLHKRALSIIITATHSASHLPDTIEVCKQLAPLDIILAVAADLANELASDEYRQCVIVPVETATSLFAGRELGARKARGDVLLFLGEEHVYSPSALQRFLFPVLYGRQQAVLAKEAHVHRRKTGCSYHDLVLLLNDGIGQQQLGNSSLIATPHAITRQALRILGAESLAHPAQAHCDLLRSGLAVDVQAVEPDRGRQPFSPLLHGSLISESSLFEQEAVAALLDVFSRLSPRGGLADGGRKREIARKLQDSHSQPFRTHTPSSPFPHTTLYGGQQLSVIIPARDEAKTIGGVIREVLRLEPAEVIVVVNGSRDQTAEVARESGVTVAEFADPLGVDTGRAVGASLAKGDILLFVDADFLIPAQDLYPFVLACQKGIDVALNDQSGYLQPQQEANLVTAARRALNIVANRKQLGIGSLVTVPFALRRQACEPIGWSVLACPPKAQLAYALANCTIQLAHAVDSFSLNRFRVEKHLSRSGHSPAAEQIVGDHIEAFQYWHERVRQKDARQETGRR